VEFAEDLDYKGVQQQDHFLYKIPEEKIGGLKAEMLSLRQFFQCPGSKSRASLSRKAEGNGPLKP
jgi:hypothetical protein